jgi:hypothetical protein
VHQSIELFQLLADIGGQMGKLFLKILCVKVLSKGFWLGASVLTILHAIFYCCLGVWQQFDAKRNLTTRRI